MGELLTGRMALYVEVVERISGTRISSSGILALDDVLTSVRRHAHSVLQLFFAFNLWAALAQGDRVSRGQREGGIQASDISSAFFVRANVLRISMINHEGSRTPWNRILTVAALIGAMHTFV